jgi:hypothetical protein
MRLNYEDALVSIFQLVGFRAGVHILSDQDKRVVHEQNVRMIWTADITHFAQPVTVSVMHIDNGASFGLILTSPIYKPKNRLFAGPNPLTSVKLENWFDPVEQALSSIDLITLPVSRSSGEPNNFYSFSLRFQRWLVSADIGVVAGPSGQPSLDRLGKAVIDSIYFIRDCYSNPEITDVLAEMMDFE